MGIPRFFKLPKHKQFNYQPLYYDPEKEAREARAKRIAASSGDNSEKKYIPNISRGSMREYYKREKKKVHKQSNIRLIFIIAILFIIAYLLLFY